MAIRQGIAFLCTTGALGGIELNVLRLAMWLSERGHDCCIVGIAGSPLLERASSIGLHTIALSTPRRYGAFGAARMLAKTLLRRGSSFLVMNAPRDMNLGVLTKRASRNALRLLQVQHMQFGSSKKDVFHSWEYGQLDAWIAPLPWLAKQTMENATIEIERIHTIPFGIELARFRERPMRAAARRLLDLPEDVWLCGTVGRFDYGKGQEYTLRAVSVLREQGIEIHSLLVGEDTRGEGQGYGSMLHALAQELGIADLIHFRPFRDDVETAYAAMDAFVLTSISETYGMVTIEAMASGLPVVATNSAGTPDIISNGKTGLLVSIRDYHALAKALRTLHADAELAAALAAAASKDAETRFSHEQYCVSIEQLFGTL